ncbi:hypothetical protein ABW21_db0209386 [Orbilia brochopaga]|nr:hypothetical protein ABW21_db0209386 [Drechslerella brochopaga]
MRSHRTEYKLTSISTAFWPPPSGDLQGRLHIEKQPAQKGDSHAPLVYPRDFQPYIDPIESSTVADTQSQRPDDDPEVIWTNRPAKRQEQQQEEKEEEDQESEEDKQVSDWDQTPLSQLKKPGQHVAEDEEGSTYNDDDEEEEEDEDEGSDDESLDPNPPPESSADPQEIPFTREELMIPGVDGVPPAALVRESTPGRRAPSFPFQSSIPETSSTENEKPPEPPRQWQPSSAHNSNREVAVSEPQASATASKGSTSTIYHDAASAQRPGQEGEDEHEVEEKRDAGEAHIQVHKTPSQPPPRHYAEDDEDEDESSQEEDDVEEGSDEDEAVPATSQFQSPLRSDTPAARSPLKQQKTDDMRTSHTRAVSVTSSTITLKATTVKTDEGEQDPRRQQLRKSLKTTDIDEELRQLQEQAAKEQVRREREKHFQSSDN